MSVRKISESSSLLDLESVREQVAGVRRRRVNAGGRAPSPPGWRRPPLPLLLIVAVAVAARILWLDRVPGIEGDEAWHGVLGQHWAAGDLRNSRTPTGNYPGPMQPALVALGQWVLPSHFVVLRIPTVLASLGAMALAWQIGRRHLDASTARLALLLMAALPANIVYARFGWDPSYGGLILLAGLAAALERQLVLTALLFGLGVWTHPTNVFATPMLLIVFAAADRRAGRPWLARTAALAAAIVMLAAAMMSTAVQAGQFADPSAILRRLVAPGDWIGFFVLLGRLIAGQPWFVHIAGTGYGPWLPLVDLVGIAAVAATIGATLLVLRREGLTTAASILLGWLCTIVAFALIGGYTPLNAPTERYAFVLIAPSALALAIATRQLATTKARETAISLGAGVLLLGATVALYLVPIATRDSVEVNRFMTGPVEPKEAAARWLVDQARRGPMRVVAEDWWLYWPLEYRLHGENVTVVDADNQPAEAARPFAGRTFDATFAGTSVDRQWVASGARPEFIATGYDGRPILRLWERSRAPSPILSAPPTDLGRESRVSETGPRRPFGREAHAERQLAFPGGQVSN